MGNDLADFLLNKFNEKENIQEANKQRNNELVRASEDLIQEIEQWLSSAVESRVISVTKEKEYNVWKDENKYGFHKLKIRLTSVNDERLEISVVPRFSSVKKEALYPHNFTYYEYSVFLDMKLPWLASPSDSYGNPILMTDRERYDYDFENRTWVYFSSNDRHLFSESAFISILKNAFAKMG